LCFCQSRTYGTYGLTVGSLKSSVTEALSDRCRLSSWRCQVFQYQPKVRGLSD
jgi:hypothetical protein